MISLSYDLHIHSCLSPCGDDDMTPGNIVGMAVVNGLDLIALTDHNSCKNCPAFLAIAEAYGITALPGMELTTSEEVHVVCLFPDLEKALAWDAYVYEHLIPVPNRVDIFGKQQICNEDDEVIGTVENLLINVTDISFDQVYDLVTSFGGIMIPAHLDKTTTSLLSNLGFIPPESRFTCAEIKDMTKFHEIKRQNPYLEHCRIISDSDAHYLEHIRTPLYTLQVESRRPEDILKALITPPY